jgi:aminoglycoside phosphotransferase (APT) family kinase protein
MIGSGTQKFEWQELPQVIRTKVEELLGAPVTFSETQPGGFSPGVAAKVLTSRGRRAFVKSVSSLISKPSAEANRREIRVMSALHDNHRVPKLLYSFEEGSWITLIYEIVEGKHPDLPWNDDELDFVLSELAELSSSLTPCPHPEVFTNLAERDQDTFTGWRRFFYERSTMSRLEDPWVEKNFEALVQLETNWAAASKGTSLVHTDLRADQILITDSKAVFLDWPHAKIGASWIDFLFMFPSIVLQKGPSMSALVQRSPLAHVSKADLSSVGAALAGFFLWNSLQPPPPRLTTLREFQRKQGNVVVRWLEEDHAALSSQGG